MGAVDGECDPDCPCPCHREAEVVDWADQPGQLRHSGPAICQILMALDADERFYYPKADS